MCDGLTARQLGVVELFLKVDRSCGDGRYSWTHIPTSLSVAVGVFADDRVDTTKDSDNMGNGAPAGNMGRRRGQSSFFPADAFFLLR